MMSEQIFMGMNVIELDFERARARHILFKTRLRSILYGAEIDEQPVTSHLDCSLGQWIYNHALHVYGHLPEMQEIERVHFKIHESANALIDLYKNGFAEEAREGLPAMELIAENLSSLLSIVEAKIKTEGNLGPDLSIPDELLINYNELLQLNRILQELDLRIKEQTEKAVSAGKKIKAGESKFRNTMKQAPVGIAILNGYNFMVEMANETYLSIVDRKEEEFVGRLLFDVLPEVRAYVEPILINVLHTGTAYNGNEFEVTIRRYGKQELCYFNFIYQPLFEETGEISGIIVVATEVTQQVLARLGLQRSENQFRNLVTQSQFAKAVLKGKDFIISLANESMLRNLWRRELHDVQGKKLLEVFPELADQKFIGILENVYENGALYRESEAVAWINGYDGLRKFYLDIQYAPILEMDNRVSGIMVSVNDVTEMVRFRQQISEAADRLSLATEGTRLATWDLNIQTREIIYSARLAEIFGYNGSTQLTHEDMRSRIHHEDRTQIVEKAFEEAIATGSYSYEARIIHPDKSVHWIRTQGKMLYNEDHIPQRMLGTMMDITEQKRTEQIIKDSEKRYKDLIETMPVAVYTIDKNGYLTLFNKAAVRLWGREPEIGADQWCGSFEMYTVDGEYMRLEESPVAIALKNQQCMTSEAFIRKPDQSLRHIISTPQPIYDSNGDVTGAVNVLIDITERKEAELALKTSESKFRTLANSMPQLVWTSDAEGNLNYFNQSVYEYSGLTADKLDTYNWFQIVHPDDRQENVRSWLKSVKSGLEFLYEHRFLRKDGVYRWQLSRAIPQRNAEGKIEMWVGTSTDIHESKVFIDQLESKVALRTKELTIANNELVKTNMELAQFAYVASHDLQEPLRKIQTFATRVLETENRNLSDKGKDYLARMQASSTRMQQLIIDLLAFSRANAVEKHYEEADLNIILGNVKEQLSDVIQQQQATITSETLPTWSVIVFQFEQLFTNLIANALKFVKPEVKPVINIRTGQLSGEMIPLSGIDSALRYQYISFSDNGIGFDPQFKDRIFQVFQRLHNRSAYEGTGIGLAICKKIVDNHNGLIDAIGKPGTGATFIIYLPVN
ncbi:PAS domain S-box protein [Dyadobacter flavalbus]|uniref:histidine kinase n=1 Tax=Dyadobacter flavalbus TaxID=2579942 RepID=A0A5M8Q9X7_9BACT|nr:PAS domain S-box protein [Dyadobacter flavalbus]KAA6432787.1 PAS domain S-box protein [Dyadobacter flavalbus]